MIHRKIIGENVRAARTQMKWSQEKLAARAKLSSDYISTLERGLVNVSVDTLVKIAKAMSIRFAELVKNVDRT